MNIKELAIERNLIEAKSTEKMSDNPQPSFHSILYRNENLLKNDTMAGVLV